MLTNKRNINNLFYIFITTHLVIWTLIPTLTNNNLPLDTIEALAWGSNLDWGFNKHPPMSAFLVETFYQIFGNNDWAYYLLSQICVVFSFFIIWSLSKDFFENKIYSFLSILLLEGIYFYNYTTPEFNVYVCELPFWSLTVFYCWKGFKHNDTVSWLLFGLFAALGVLSKYLFIYLLVALDLFFIYLIVKKEFNFKFLIPLISFFIVLSPHLIWLVDNNYTTVNYALHRTGLEEVSLLNRLFYPSMFLGKQIGTLIPFFIMLFFIVSKFKTKINFKDKKLIFLIAINIIPLILIFLTSLFMGVKIRTMWMTPFYLFMGVLFIYLFQRKIVLNKLKYFFSIFLILFIFSPMAYFYISITQTDKRTDYPGKRISRVVQEKWENNFTNKIKLVGGDEWHGGNLSYHLKSRPIWDNILEAKENTLLKDIEGGFVLVGNANILKNICSGEFLNVDINTGKVKTLGICMIGTKK